MKVDYVPDITVPIIFFNLFVKTFDITLYMHLIKEIGVKSGNLTGFFFFGIKTMK